MLGVSGLFRVVNIWSFMAGWIKLLQSVLVNLLRGKGWNYHSTISSGIIAAQFLARHLVQHEYTFNTLHVLHVYESEK